MSHQFLKRSDIRWARLATSAPTFSRPKRVRGRRAAGIRYEKAAHRHFIEEYGDKYVPSPWIIFSIKGEQKSQWAQPDGLLIDLDLGLIIICEMKYQHCVEAYWQVYGKYLPLVQHIFPSGLWRIATIEIVQWYDCAVKFPARVTLKKSIDRVRPGEFGVHIWKP